MGSLYLSHCFCKWIQLILQLETDTYLIPLPGCLLVGRDPRQTLSHQPYYHLDWRACFSAEHGDSEFKPLSDHTFVISLLSIEFTQHNCFAYHTISTSFIKVQDNDKTIPIAYILDCRKIQPCTFWLETTTV